MSKWQSWYVLRELILVEDHPLVGRALVRALSPRYRVLWATTAIEARGIIEACPYDVLLCAGHFTNDAIRLLDIATKARPLALRVVYGECGEPLVARSHGAVKSAQAVPDLLALLSAG